MTERNQSLCLLRGLAVLLVVAVHCSHVATSIFPDLRSMVMQYGELGVQLFFIVSGYTMMLTFGDKVDVAGASSFYLRRVFRIVPLFWVAILFYLLTTKGEGFRYWAPGGVSAGDVLLTFLFLQWSSVTAFNSVVPGGWSIAVEMQFYLLFPLLIWLFRQRSGANLCYALIALVSVANEFAAQRYLVPRLAASLPAGQAYLAPIYFNWWLPHQLVCFGFGILLFDWIERKSLPAFGLLLLVGACQSSAWGQCVTVLAGISMICLRLGVTNAVFCLLGRHSYAIYLVHFAVVSAISALFALDLILMFILVTGLSLTLSYYVIEPLIERPFNRLGHVLASKAYRPKAVATVA